MLEGRALYKREQSKKGLENENRTRAVMVWERKRDSIRKPVERWDLGDIRGKLNCIYRLAQEQL